MADHTRTGAVQLAGGPFLMGTDDPRGYPQDGEGPVREVEVAPFAIQPTCVTNTEFAAFVDATGHSTRAERDGWSFVFDGLLPDSFEDTVGVAGTEWWRQVFGASWRRPEGPHSDVFVGADDRSNHPVVQLSWDDAMAYCAWAEVRLPTEAEWEFAARGGLEQATFPWGDELLPGGEHRCNVWQGTFPTENTLDDGWAGTAPVTTFEPNGYGLYSMVGNVWEWCADWFSRTPHLIDDPACCAPARTAAVGTQRVMKGGSYLCHDSYCFRYRVGARSANTPDSAAGNIGFRVVST